MVATETNQQIERFYSILSNEKYYAYLLEQDRKGKYFVEIDFYDILAEDLNLAEKLQEFPDEVINSAKTAIKSVDISKTDGWSILIKNVPSTYTYRVRDRRVQDLGKLVAIEGVIRAKTATKARMRSARYECPSCGNVIPIIQTEKKLKEPSRCGCGRKGKFTLLSKEFDDVQYMVVEELPENIGNTDQPKTMNVMLENSLISKENEPKYNPGSRVKLVGYFVIDPIFLKTGAQSTEFNYLFKTINIENIDKTEVNIEITSQDEEKLRELAKRENIIRTLSDCAFSHIYGYDDIKRALLLQMVGGVRKIKNGKDTRSDIHILLIGDPGTAKSEMLESINNLIPSSRKATGKGATGVGLTASVEKDEFLGGFTLRAGTLPLANKSIAIVDELDKMTQEDRSFMHEALEQQTISITKASIQATLQGQCSLLAAANPKYGRYDPYKKGVVSQIDLPATLLNRFDLIFPIKDIPDEESDDKLFDHIISMHREEKDEEEESGDLLDTDLLRKYLKYAKGKRPYLTAEAQQSMKNYLVQIRKKAVDESGNIKSIPINARQCEALVRMSEAFAKLRLSDCVTQEDTQNAIQMMHYFLSEVALDENTGQIDIDMIATGVSSEERSHSQYILNLLEDLHNQGTKAVPIESLMNKAKEKSITDGKFEKILKKLRQDGDVIEVKKGHICLNK